MSDGKQNVMKSGSLDDLQERWNHTQSDNVLETARSVTQLTNVCDRIRLCSNSFSDCLADAVSSGCCESEYHLGSCITCTLIQTFVHENRKSRTVKIPTIGLLVVG